MLKNFDLKNYVLREAQNFLFTHDGPMTVAPLPAWEVFNTPPPVGEVPCTCMLTMYHFSLQRY